MVRREKREPGAIGLKRDRGDYCVEAISKMTIEFGGPVAEAYVRGAQLRLRLPLASLGGDSEECIFGEVRAAGEVEGIALFHTQDLMIGWALQPVGVSVAQSAHDVYLRLFRVCAGLSLCRIWNYVPAINRVQGELENYRAFNAGRARAFEEILGADYNRALPAGSAVGCRGDSIAVVFVAKRGAPEVFENPDQTPAYEYPPEHGPRSPSFSRATAITADGGRIVFISGTAAIKGHGTVAPGAFDEQLDCTLDNLRLISREVGLGDDLGAGTGARRHFKIYLRHASDYEAASARLGSQLLRTGDSVIWLQTDLCRQGLNVEIEGTLLSVTQKRP